MAPWFAHGAVRLTDPPVAYWTREDETRLLRRMGYADFVALGRFDVVRVHSRRSTTHEVALIFRATKIFHGQQTDHLDQDDDLILAMGPDSPDFRRALAAQRQLPGQRVVLFAKHKPAKGPAPTPVSGWRASLWPSNTEPHLEYVWVIYRPEQELIGRIKLLYDHLHENAD